MSGYQDYLNAYLGINAQTQPDLPKSVPAPIGGVKVQQVSEASSRIKAELDRLSSPVEGFDAIAGRETGNGVISASEQEMDFRNLSPLELELKYGAKVGADLTDSRTAAEIRYAAPKRQTRSHGDVTRDSLLSGYKAAVGGVGGIAALIAAAVDDDAGVVGAKLVKGFNDEADKHRSDVLAGEYDNFAAAERQAARDSAFQYEKDVKTDGKAIATMKNVGRDVLSSLDNILENPTITGDVLANAGGSLISGAALTKGITTAGGKAITAIAGKAGQVTPKLADLGVRGASTLSIVAQEAGGAYSQTTMEAYELLADRKDLTEDQRVELASAAGKLAAATQAPIAAVTGYFVAKIEAHPLRVTKPMEAVQAVIKEGVEEGIQSGTGAFAENLGIKEYVDPSRDLTQSVGSQIAQGIVGGSGSTQVAQAPGVALSLPVAVTKNVAKAAIGAVDDRYNAIMSRAKQASPVSDKNVGEAVEMAMNAAPEVVQQVQQAIEQSDMSPEDKQAVLTQMGKLAGSLQFDEEKLAASEAPEQLKSVLTGSISSFDAMQKLAGIINDGSADNATKLSAAQMLYDQLADNEASFHSIDPAIIEKIPEDHPIMQAWDQYAAVSEGILQSETVRDAILKIEAVAKKASENGELSPVTDAELSTPAGQQKIQNTLTVAEASPLDLDPDSINKILFHAESGIIKLTPRQRTVLQSASSLIQAQRDYIERLKSQNQAENKDLVSDNIITKDYRRGRTMWPSASSYMKNILAATRSGDTEMAVRSLQDLADFSQHMQNKVGALNEHLAKGDGTRATAVRYKQLGIEDRSWKQSSEGLYVNRTNPTSIRLAQQIGNEAATLAKFTNDLVAVFPELGVKPIQAASLNEELAGPADEIVKRTQDLNSVETVTEAVTPDVEPAPVEAVEPTKENEPGVETVENDETAPVEEAAVDELADVEPKPEPAGDGKADGTVGEGIPGPVPAEASDAIITAAQPKTVQEAYPDLVGSKPGKIVNLFHTVYNFPKKARTRLIGEASPLARVKEALGSQEALIAFLGSKTRNKLTPEITQEYADYLDMGQSVKSQLAKQLQAYLAKNGDRWVEKGFLNELDNGKALNLVEDRDGKLAYNEQLLEQTVLAGLQWMLEANNHKSIRDGKDAASILGIPSDQLTDDHPFVLDLRLGLMQIDAQPSLADKIMAFWGVEARNDAAIGHARGIAEAMAGEVLEALVHIKVLEAYQLKSSDYNLDLGEGFRTVNMFNVVLDPDRAAYAFPDAINQVVLVDPPKVNHIGVPPATVPTTQLRNAGAKLTADTRKALEARQNTKHFVNMPFIDMMKMLGMDRVLKLFASGPLDDLILNERHRKTLEGRNLTFGSAFNSLQRLMMELNNQAEFEGTPAEEMPIYYERQMTKVNRMQQMGDNSPQASKLMREAVSATHSVIDLSTVSSGHYSAYLLALAQALGVKVHNVSRSEAETSVIALLSDKYAKTVELLQDWVKAPKTFSDAEFAILTEELKGGDQFEGVEPVKLHALIDYARYLNQRDENPSGLGSYKTSIYVEADGVTNGPGNAIQMLTSRFTPGWLQNSRRVGLFPGSGDQTMNGYRAQDGVDLYKAASNALENMLADVPQSDDVRALGNLMGMFLPDQVSYDDTKSSFGFDRGMIKNPLTVMLYGASAPGIAGKITQNLVQSIYERASHALFAMKATPGLTEAEAMFPEAADRAEAVKHFEAMITQLSRLTNSQVKFDLVSFALDGKQEAALREQMLAHIVEPLQQAIHETVGQEVIDNANNIRRAVQVQSIALQWAFRRAVQKKLADKKASDPKFNRSAFLTQLEVNELLQELAPLSPAIQTKDQSYYISGQTRANLGLPGETAEETRFGAALSGRMSVPGMVYGPADAGVAGIPTIVIGFGDGMMMQHLSLDDDLAGRTLDVFDGLNMPLDMVEEFSVKANEAAYKAWSGNPVQAVLETYQEFLKSFEAKSFDQAELDAYVKALFDPTARRGKRSSDVKAEILSLADALEKSAKAIASKQDALKRIGLTVDQMAAVGSPYVQEGEGDLEQLSDDALLAKLQDFQNNPVVGDEAAETKDISKDIESETINADLLAAGRELKTGVRKIGFDGLRKLVSRMNVPQAQKSLLREIVRLKAVQDYTIVFGTPEQVRAYALERDLPIASVDDYAGTKINGYIDPQSKTLYLHNPTSETLLHELIHAATLEKLEAYYAGVPLGSNQAEQVEAIRRIEGLMQQALSDEFATQLSGLVDATGWKAYSDMLGAIKARLSQGDKPGALNEYMAWSLSNSQLQKAQKGVQANPLSRMIRTVWQSIKQLVFGRKMTVPFGEDMLSQLRFNTSILLRNRMEPRARFTNSIYFHNEAYGNNSRLERVQEVLAHKIVRHLRRDVSAANPGLNEQARDAVVGTKMEEYKTSVEMALRAADSGFSMSVQERSTFTMLLGVMKASMDLDANALTRMSQIYAHVLKTIKVEDFMEDPDSDEQADRYWPEFRYNLIVGKLGKEYDKLDRSTLLSTFMALALVNDDFRKVLAKLPMPTNKKTPATSVDSWLENIGNSAMDGLSAMVSGEGRKSENVRVAMDALLDRLVDVAEERETFMERFAKPTGNLMDRANVAATGAIQNVAGVLTEKGKALKADGKNKGAKLLGSSLGAIAGIIDERTGSKIAEGLVATMSKVEGWHPMRALINDLVGRTETNAPIVDMIKRVQNWVQQHRQQFREHLPKVIEGEFSRKLSDDEQTHLFLALGKTDLASLAGTFSNDEVLKILSDTKILDKEIDNLKQAIVGLDAANAPLIEQKIEQLVRYISEGRPGQNLLRNAHAIAHLLNEGVAVREVPDDLVTAIDNLTSLLAVKSLPSRVRERVSLLVQKEPKGIAFMYDYLRGQRKDEMAKAMSDNALFNHYKGWVPQSTENTSTLIVANDEEFSKLTSMSFVRLGNYTGQGADTRKAKMGYYYSPISGKAAFQQGIMQNIRLTAYGVDLATGHSDMLTAGRITHPVQVQRTQERLANSVHGKGEPLMPVFSHDGKVVAFERSVDPVMLARIEKSTHMSKMLGVWRGRQFEEQQAREVNHILIERLHEMYENDIKADAKNQAQYVDVLSDKEWAKDPVLRDAVKLFTKDTYEQIEKIFGDQFWVRRELLTDAFGERAATVGDAWTGTSRMPQGVMEAVKKLATAIMGADAYRRLIQAERFLSEVASSARVTIVVKSVIVPMSNLISNCYQLWARGVPMAAIVKGMPKKTAEVHFYLKSRIELDTLEAKLRAAHDNHWERNSIEAQMQSILDAHKRLSIWPLIEAGEFSSISDSVIGAEDLQLASGRLNEYIEGLVDKLPQGLKTLGRYGYITQDTALFQGLQKAVAYGDFLAKAVLYDDMTKRQGIKQREALGRISDEFVNYDRQPGRMRGYLENIGLLWFYNFKLRSTKVALSIMRHNPAHLLFTMGVPMPSIFGSVGLPVSENIMAMAAEGSLNWSMGPGMGVSAHTLNPWFNFVEGMTN